MVLSLDCIPLTRRARFPSDPPPPVSSFASPQLTLLSRTREAEVVQTGTKREVGAWSSLRGVLGCIFTAPRSSYCIGE